MISLPSAYSGEGSSIPGSVPPNDMVTESVVGITPGDFDMVI